MDQQNPQIEKKGLSKGCTVALIIGGVVVVLVVALIILFWVKRKDVAKWAYIQAIVNEKQVIMTKQIPGIDTVAVNIVADAFKQNIESSDFEFDQALSFQVFVQQYATDAKADSAEAAQFVEAMIECYPELREKYKPIIREETPMDEKTDSSSHE